MSHGDPSQLLAFGPAHVENPNAIPKTLTD
jgi:hypothetical protein